MYINGVVQWLACLTRKHVYDLLSDVILTRKHVYVDTVGRDSDS